MGIKPSLSQTRTLTLRYKNPKNGEKATVFVTKECVLGRLFNQMETRTEKMKCNSINQIKKLIQTTDNSFTYIICFSCYLNPDLAPPILHFRFPINLADLQKDRHGERWSPGAGCMGGGKRCKPGTEARAAFAQEEVCCLITSSSLLLIPINSILWSELTGFGKLQF